MRYIITILVDNSVPLPTKFLTEYGYSLLIEDLDTDTIVLFDTGTTGKPLLHNLTLTGYSPDDIDYLVLSHRHYDHTGGLLEFLKARSTPITIIAHPDLFVPAYTNLLGGSLRDIGLPFTRSEIESNNGKLLLVKEKVQLAPGIYTTGEIPRNWGPSHTKGMLRLEDGELKEDLIVDDIALVLEKDNEFLVITGCGHAGVENIVEHAKSISSKEFAGIVGGLHLLGAPKERENKVVDYLVAQKPKIVAAGHCTGSFVQGSLRDKLGYAYKLSGAGLTIEF